MVFFWSSLKYWDHRHVSPCRHSMPFCDWVTPHYIDRLQWVHGHFGCFYLWLLGIMLLQTLMHFVYGRTFSIPLGVDSRDKKNTCCVSLRVENVQNRQSTLIGTTHIGVRVPETGRREFWPWMLVCGGYFLRRSSGENCKCWGNAKLFSRVVESF